MNLLILEHLSPVWLAQCVDLMDSSNSFGHDNVLRLRKLEREVLCLMKKVKDQKNLNKQMNTEAGKNFKMIDEDTLQIREDFADSLHKEARRISNQIMESHYLYGRLIKLEMQVGHLTFDWNLHWEATTISVEKLKGGTNLHCEGHHA